MNRFERFLKYYKLLNDYVILFEVIHGKHDDKLYPKFLEAHRHVFIENKDLPDDEFTLLMDFLTSCLISEYAMMLNNYLNRNYPLFQVAKNMNHRVKSSYENIVNTIKAVTSEGLINIQNIVDNLDVLEKEIKKHSIAL